MSAARRDRALVGDEYSPDQYFLFRSAPARRTVLTDVPSGKPSIALLPNGDVLVSYLDGYNITQSLQDRVGQKHVASLLRSSDGGRTWSEPVSMTQPPALTGDGYLIPFADGHVLFCYMRLEPNEPARPWQGPYICESTDGGRTWSEPWQVDISRFCPNGPYGAGDRGHVVLPDGTLLLFVSTYEAPPNPYEYMLVSHDRGRTFSDYVRISDYSGDSSFCLCPDGVIAAALRMQAHNYPHRRAQPKHETRGERTHYMAYATSTDAGRTWSEPQQLTDYNQIPGHITCLQDGRLLMSYGVRSYPLGVQAVLSDPGRSSWDLENRIMLAWNGGMWDNGRGYARHTVGHPYTQQLPDGTLLTVYYRMLDPFEPTSMRVEALFWTPPQVTAHDC